MSDTGYDLGVDCAELYHAGSTILPAISGEFFLSSSYVTAGDAEYAFTRDGSIGLGPTGPYGIWSKVCDILDTDLEKTGKNLADTGTALCLAANTYAKTDAAAQAEYDRRRKEMGDS